MKKKKEKKHYLTVFLLKEKFKKLSDIVQPAGSEKSFEGLDGKSVAYLYKNNDRVPHWAQSFSDIFRLGKIGNLIHALIVYIEVDHRIYVFTTSFGHTKIQKEQTVDDFGLKIVLNEIDDKSLRAIDLRKLTLSSHQRREVSSSNSSIKDFEFNSDEDFLKSASGKMIIGGSMISLTGSDSLKIIKRFNINEITDFCRELYESYKKSNYKNKGFDFIDNLKRVHDSDVYLKLKKEMAKALNKRDGNKILLAYPEIEHYNFCNYKIIYQRQVAEEDDINIDILFAFLDKYNINSLDGDELSKIKIELLDEKGDIYESQGYRRHYNLLNYLVFEFEQRNKKYIFIDSQLYEIENDYYEKLKKILKRHEINSSKMSIVLPAIMFKDKKTKKGKKIEVEKELHYNKRVEQLYSNKVANFDTKLFRHHLQRKSGVEICDLLTKSGEFICVKIYKNSSSVLSHLFFQGSVSAELLASLEEYSKEITKQVDGKFRINLKDRQKIKFVFAIAMQRDGFISEQLPIFSKISLRKAIYDIEKMGFSANVLKIDFTNK